MSKTMNKIQISKSIKIKSPFLMIDQVKKLSVLKSGIGIKKITKNSWFFKCHFINDPVMPGSLIQEAMLQTIVCIIYSSKKFKNKICLITGVKNSYYSKVENTTTLYSYAKIIKFTLTKIEAAAIVKDGNGKKIASGNFNYFITKK